MSIEVENPPVPVLYAAEVHENTSGWAVEQRAGRLAVAYVHEDIRTDRYRDSLALDLSIARSAIATIHEDHAGAVEEYCDTYMPSFLQEAKRNNSKTKNWRGWFRSAPDAQVINALQWNVDATRRQQHNPEVMKAIDAEKLQYQERVGTAVANGWIHADALRSASKLHDINVYIGDFFDTYCRDRSAYHTRGTKEVVISGAGNVPDIVKHIKSDTKHELNHAVLGSFEDRWFDEAVTEHIAQSLDRGEEGILAPFARTTDPYTYLVERDLLNDLLTRGKNTIPVQQVTRAYSQKSSNSEKVELFDAIEESWQHVMPEEQSIMRALRVYLAQREDKYVSQGERLSSAQRSAVFDAQIALLRRDEELLHAGMQKKPVIAWEKRAH